MGVKTVDPAYHAGRGAASGLTAQLASSVAGLVSWPGFLGAKEK